MNVILHVYYSGHEAPREAQLAIAKLQPLDHAAYQAGVEWAVKSGDFLLQEQIAACHGVFEAARSIAEMHAELGALKCQEKLALRKPTEELLEKIRQYRSRLSALLHHSSS